MAAPGSIADARAPLPARPLAAEPDSFDVHAAAWARAFFSHPNRVTTGLWAGAAAAIISVLPLAGWPHRSFLTLIVTAGACGVACGTRFLADGRLPRWVLHVDVALATMMASLLAAIGPTNHVPFAYLYVWIALFAAMYFRPRAALAHCASVAVAYGLVLLFGPSVAEPAAAWLALFGTTSLVAVLVLGLTGVLRSTARKDPLTGLANRRMWDERFDEEIERSARSGAALSILMVDLDDFKAINDAGGHQAGDRLLHDLAQAWRGVVRGGGDFLARLGGDEFCLLAPGADEIGAHALAKRLTEAIPQGVSASIGVATWDRTENASALLRRADLAMYRNKQRHRRDTRRSSA